MAKQSGLHQIRGKVGEHSYYKQTGVASGLIRSINQGMSARVKTGAEYANTRLNNQEFGAACNTAALLGQMVTPKFRPMILPFSQSKMSKEILKLARQNSGTWGQRTVQGSQTAQLAAILAAQSKRDYTQFVNITLTRSDVDTVNARAVYSTDQSTLMSGLGINKLLVNCFIYNLATGNWNAAGQEMATGYLETADSITLLDEDIIPGGTSGSDEDLTASAFVPAPNHSGHQIAVFVILPMRTINSIDNILQEYCSFTAIPVPASV